MDDVTKTPDVSRRIMIRSTALGAVAVPVLAACGDDAPTAEPGGSTTTPTTTSTPGGGGGGGGSAEVLAATSDVEVGGALFLDSEDVPGEEVPNGVVITQPAAGEFHAFSRDCSHMHCAVADIQDGKIHCPCHGSEYDMATGAVVGGPAPAPLNEVPFEIKKGNIIRA
ncbi:MAG TPA: Rieske (2Fe-2S) protein [Nocardioidaceae bacterium]|nr:Rieske (2Fe-2S) protein [Nocardioidaceae bacterium]